MESLRDGVLVHVDGQIAFANSAAAQLFGVPAPLDLVGRSVVELVRDDGSGSLESLLRRGGAAEPGHGLAEVRLSTLDGRSIDVELSAAAVDRDGRSGFQLVLRDVSASKRREAALRENEAKFRTMIETMPDPVSLSDLASGEYLEVNEAWCAFTGFRRDQVVGRRMEDLPLWSDPEDRRRFGRELKRAGLLQHFDARLRGREGRERIGSLSAARLRFGDRDVVMVWTRDVTEQREAAEALRDSEERFRSLATFAPIGIFQTDGAGSVLYTNPRWQQLAGISLEQSLGDGYATAVHPDDRGWVVKEWARCVRDNVDFDGEFRFQTPRGEVRCVRTTTTALRSPNGAVAGFIGTNQDISERKSIEEMRADFVRTLSHDIKNPLSLVLGYVDLLRDDLRAERDPAEAIDAMESSARQAMGLALDFLEADRIKSGNLQLSKTRGSLNEIVARVVRQHSSRARMRRIDLCSDLDVSLGEFDLDAALVERVVTNLLSNAIKFSKPGTAVYVDTRGRDGRAFVAVRDSGPGVTEQDRERLFQRYGRGSSARSDSTGLGLFIVKTITEAHGGGVDLRSAPGGGSVFEVWLPTAPS